MGGGGGGGEGGAVVERGMNDTLSRPLLVS